MGEWWLTELEGDPAYEEVVTPMLFDVLEPEPGALYLDLGSGEGRVMRAVQDRGSRVHGVELNQVLATRSAEAGPTVVARLPDLSSCDSDSYDGAYCVLVLEHIPGPQGLFRGRGTSGQARRDALSGDEPSGLDCSGIDPDHRHRWGGLVAPRGVLLEGVTDEPVGKATVRFHHRPLGDHCSTPRQMPAGRSSEWSRPPTTSWKTRMGSLA